ncbi:MAG: hypothetical protein WAW41_11645, partial [Methylobacter sp.]
MTLQNSENEQTGRTVWDVVILLLNVLRKRKKSIVFLVLTALAVFSASWLFSHLLASEGTPVRVLGLIEYTKGTSDISQVGYVPVSAVTSEDKHELKPGTAVTIRANSTILRSSPHSESGVRIV